MQCKSQMCQDIIIITEKTLFIKVIWTQKENKRGQRQHQI